MNILTRRSAIALGCGSTFCLLGLGGIRVHRPRTRPPLHRGIPDRPEGYAFESFSPTAIATSFGPVPLIAEGADPERLHPHVFQFIPARLEIEHCTIRQASLRIQASGEWSMNLRAEQNVPSPLGEGIETFTGRRPDTLQTLHILRNRFYVTAVGYGFAAAATPEDENLGRPVMFEICLKPFWVERGQSRRVVQSGKSPDVTRNFVHVDRAEIEFYFER